VLGADWKKYLPEHTNHVDVAVAWMTTNHDDLYHDAHALTRVLHDDGCLLIPNCDPSSASGEWKAALRLMTKPTLDVQLYDIAGGLALVRKQAPFQGAPCLISEAEVFSDPDRFRSHVRAETEFYHVQPHIPKERIYRNALHTLARQQTL
jgi:hypothetical protein